MEFSKTNEYTKIPLKHNHVFYKIMTNQTSLTSLDNIAGAFVQYAIYCTLAGQ